MLTSSRTTNILLVVMIAVGVTIVAMLASGVRGGPLDPPGVPASTMQTLDDIPGSWSRELPSNDGAPGPDPPAGCNSSRFKCVFSNSAGVLDRETGLVWQRRVNPFAFVPFFTAYGICSNAYPAGRYGWRLPTHEELKSLRTANPGDPKLPAGHPFTDVVNVSYWTATTVGDTDNSNAFAYIVDFGSTAELQYLDKATSARVWCVRGGQGYDGKGYSAAP